MYTALEKSINNATDVAALDKAAGMITMCLEETKSIDGFEAGLLKDLLVSKKAELTGVKTEDINVEDIPF